MAIFSLHGLFYMFGWAMQGRLSEELVGWKNVGVANLPGVISLAADLLMWVISLPRVGRKNFELFFYTHQLYVVFVVFLALHTGDFIFMIAGAGIFLLCMIGSLDSSSHERQLTYFQPHAFLVELLNSLFQNLQIYITTPLAGYSYKYASCPGCSATLFSVSSSPLDGKHHLAILIKVLGDWTEKLKGNILNLSVEQSDREPLLQHNRKITASVEGPYGHESPYHLTYENLILVAGGIGVSPFLAILSDILHCINDSTPCLPRNILIVGLSKTQMSFHFLIQLT